MNILFATTEAVPFCKTGGLGDVCGSLPRALASVGQKPTIIMPAFRQALDSGYPVEDTGTTFEIPIGQKRVSGRLLRSQLPGTEVPVYLIEQADYFGRDGLYGEHGEDYQDNCERFVFYCRAVLDVIDQLDLQIDVLHCHDWCAGLLPAYIKTLYGDRPPYDRLATLYTIHNLAYQGNFWHWDMALTGPRLEVLQLATDGVLRQSQFHEDGHHLCRRDQYREPHLFARNHATSFELRHGRFASTSARRFVRYPQWGRLR